ncbi:MAG TPA: succinate dehydrogenase [Candidatus Angelobacter sp.]|nr:succinate dehydrogenase [Candidatus Angelobacter sp.]
MADTPLPILQEGFGSTRRRDAWWMEILPVIVVLGGFGLYATLRAFENQFYQWGPYLSPFYSPLFNVNWTIFNWRVSPAILILGGPLSFRATCYYYRKAYYRAFFMDPPSCAVGEPRKSYSGETRFPFILQNLHRFAFYLAVLFLAALWYDVFLAFFNWNGGHFGIGVGSIVMLVNIVFLSLYTFSCHSFRHLVGGKLDCFSCTAATRQRHGAWKRISFLNERHMLWAWISLFTVALTDVYIRLVSSGAIKDLRIL